VALVSAYFAIDRGLPDALDFAWAVLAEGELLACAPGVTREHPIEVALIRARLEEKLARREVLRGG
jgi:hypothetical protein